MSYVVMAQSLLALQMLQPLDPVPKVLRNTQELLANFPVRL